jgi:glycosyltransferase involved in cell wall biosynthesis
VNPQIAVVIPCFRVTRHIADVVAKIPSAVNSIYVVDDACPEHSGQFLQQQTSDPRVVVLFNQTNLGVGGAVMVGYQAAIADGADIIIKIDGDGQMDPALIPNFIEPEKRTTPKEIVFLTLSCLRACLGFGYSGMQSCR